jgi:hypothetical protein
LAKIFTARSRAEMILMYTSHKRKRIFCCGDLDRGGAVSLISLPSPSSMSQRAPGLPGYLPDLRKKHLVFCITYRHPLRKEAF